MPGEATAEREGLGGCYWLTIPQGLVWWWWGGEGRAGGGGEDDRVFQTVL